MVRMRCGGRERTQHRRRRDRVGRRDDCPERDHRGPRHRGNEQVNARRPPRQSSSRRRRRPGRRPAPNYPADLGATRRTPRRAAPARRKAQHQFRRNAEGVRAGKKRQQRTTDRQENRIRRPDAPRRGRQNHRRDEKTEKLNQFRHEPLEHWHSGSAVNFRRNRLAAAEFGSRRRGRKRRYIPVAMRLICAIFHVRSACAGRSPFFPMASMTELMPELLEAGVHFGHQTKRWNPKMKPFIFEKRNAIYIINLDETVKQLERGDRFPPGSDAARRARFSSSAARSRRRKRSRKRRSPADNFM